jgi:hypothetical protein
MNYLDIHNLSQSQDMQNRTGISCLKTAQFILSEDPTTPDHDKRVNWANWVMQNPSPSMMPSQQAFTYVCLDPTIQAGGTTATDEQISATVSAALPFLIPLAPGNATMATMGMIAPPPPPRR